MNRRSWTMPEIAILKERIRQQIPRKLIAEELGRTTASVNHIARRHSLIKRNTFKTGKNYGNVLRRRKRRKPISILTDI